MSRRKHRCSNTKLTNKCPPSAVEVSLGLFPPFLLRKKSVINFPVAEIGRHFSHKNRLLLFFFDERLSLPVSIGIFYSFVGVKPESTQSFATQSERKVM